MVLAEALDGFHLLHFGTELVTSAVTLFVLWKTTCLIRRTESEWERQHVRRTPLAAIHGLVVALRSTPELDETQRQKLYAAIEEQARNGLDRHGAEANGSPAAENLRAVS